MPKIQRDQKKAIKHAKHLEKFGDIVKHRRGVVPILGGGRIDIIFDHSVKASEEQVFLMRITCPKDKHIIELPISKQAWEHVSRAI